MNRKQQQKHVGEFRRLRPIPTNSQGVEVDDKWTVTSADDTGLLLNNHRTGHILRLGYDHILEYRTPDFLILKSTVTLQPQGLVLEPIVTPPKATLEAMPLPLSTQRSEGLWVQEIHVRSSKPEPVADATVEIIFAAPYLSGSYEVVASNPTQAMIIRELFGAEGQHNSAHFKMGLVELPRATWLRFEFVGQTPPQPRDIKLTPYFKY